MVAASMIAAPCVPTCRMAAAPSASRKSAVARVPCAKTEWSRKTVSNGIKTRAMMVWQPFNNKMFETFSYLPPLSDQEIANQINYITYNGWTPCLEFANAEQAYVGNESTIRFGSVASLYQDNRYWTMWKLPMFGCSDPGQVLNEIQNCRRAFPDCYIRLVAFDADRQMQITGFLVQRPSSARDWKPIDKRQV